MSDTKLIEGRLAENGPRLRSHCVRMDNRELLSVTGVLDVGSFNETEVVLTTDAGGLTVDGVGLHITKLDLDDGQVIVEGRICAAVYDEDVPEKKGSIFRRMFR